MPRHEAGPDDEASTARQHPALVVFLTTLGILPMVIGVVVLALMVVAVIVTLAAAR
jgi:hypothetical protein